MTALDSYLATRSTALRSGLPDWRDYLRGGGGPQTAADIYGEGSDMDLLNRAQNTYMTNEIAANVLGAPDPEGLGAAGLLEKAASVIDAPRSALFGFLTGAVGADLDGDPETDEGGALSRAWKGLTGEEQYGAGDLDVLRMHEDDSGIERFIKGAGAFAIDTAMDPLTYVSFGGSVLGKKAATEVAERGVKAAVDSFDDDVLEAAGKRVLGQKAPREGFEEIVGENFDDYARRRADIIKRRDEALAAGDGQGAAAIMGELDDGAEQVYKVVEAALDPSSGNLRQLGVDQLGAEAAEAFQRGGATGLRKHLVKEYGEEVGEDIWSKLPRDVQGGLRIRAPFARKDGNPLSIGVGGGGQIAEKFGADDLLMRMHDWRTRLRGSKAGRFFGDKLQGRDAALYGGMVTDLARTSDPSDPNRLAGVTYHMYAGKRDAVAKAQQWAKGADEQTQQTLGLIARQLHGVGEDNAEAVMERLKYFVFNPQVVEERRAAGLGGLGTDEVIGGALEGLDDIDRAALIGAALFHDYMKAMRQQLLDAGVDVNYVDDYVARIMTETEKTRRERLKPVRGSQRGSGRLAGFDQTKQRNMYVRTIKVLLGEEAVPPAPGAVVRWEQGALPGQGVSQPQVAVLADGSEAAVPGATPEPSAWDQVLPGMDAPVQRPQERLVSRDLNPAEINKLEGRDVFEEDPLKILSGYGDAARRLGVRVKFANLLREKGLVAMADVEGRNIVKRKPVQFIGELLDDQAGEPLDPHVTAERASLQAQLDDAGRRAGTTVDDLDPTPTRAEAELEDRTAGVADELAATRRAQNEARAEADAAQAELDAAQAEAARFARERTAPDVDAARASRDDVREVNKLRRQLGLEPLDDLDAEASAAVPEAVKGTKRALSAEQKAAAKKVRQAQAKLDKAAKKADSLEAKAADLESRGAASRQARADTIAAEGAAEAERLQARLDELDGVTGDLWAQESELRDLVMQITNATDSDAAHAQVGQLVEGLIEYYERHADELSQMIGRGEGDVEALKQARSAVRARLRKTRALADEARTGTEDIDRLGQFYVDRGLKAIGSPNDTVGTTPNAILPAELDPEYAPQVMQQAIRNFYEVQSGQSEEAKKFLDAVYKPYFSLFKLYATVGRGPGYHARNLMGGLWNNFVGGVTGGDHRLSARLIHERTRAWKQAVGEATQDLVDESGIPLREARSMLPAEAVQARADDLLRERLSDIKVGADHTLYDVHRASLFDEVGQNTRVQEGTHGLLKTNPDPTQVRYYNADPRRAFENQGVPVNVFPGREADDLNVAQRWTNQYIADNPWIRLNKGWQGKSEDFLRNAAFIRGIRRYGMDPAEEAAEEGPRSAGIAKLFADGLHFDYDDLSDFERNVLRGTLIPFYTWMRNNVPLQFRVLMRDPGKMNGLIRANETARDIWGDDSRELIPEWMREKMGWKTRYKWMGNPILAGIESPAMDLNKFIKLGRPGEAIEGMFKNSVVGALSPVVKLPIEIGLGYNAFTGANFPEGGVDAPGWYRILPDAIAPTRTTAEGEIKAPAAIVKLIQDALPPVGQQERLAPSTERYQERWLTTMLSQLAAVPVSTLTPSQELGELTARNERIRRNIDWSTNPHRAQFTLELLRNMNLPKVPPGARGAF